MGGFGGGTGNPLQGAARADGQTVAAAGATLSVKNGVCGTAQARWKTDRVVRAGFAAGTADDMAIGQAGVANGDRPLRRNIGRRENSRRNGIRGDTGQECTKKKLAASGHWRCVR